MDAQNEFANPYTKKEYLFFCFLVSLFYKDNLFFNKRNSRNDFATHGDYCYSNDQSASLFTACRKLIPYFKGKPVHIETLVYCMNGEGNQTVASEEIEKLPNSVVDVGKMAD